MVSNLSALETGELHGEPTPVLEDVQLVQGGSRGRFSISDGGTLVSTVGGTSTFDVGNSRELLLVGLDATERVLPLSPRPTPQAQVLEETQAC